jgi:hypothetical protein
VIKAWPPELPQRGDMSERQRADHEAQLKAHDDADRSEVAE